MKYRTPLAYAAASIVLVLGLVALLNPLAALRFLGLEAGLPRAASEIRTTYGALFTVMGAGMLWAVPKRPRAAMWLRIPGILWLAMAAGRLASIIIDSTLSPVNAGTFLLELFVGLAALLGSYQTPAPRAATTPPSARRGRGS
ncbi:MAG TPA: DUF4345 family protein [Trueperaceae bacterium]